MFISFGWGFPHLISVRSAWARRSCLLFPLSPADSSSDDDSIYEEDRQRHHGGSRRSGSESSSTSQDNVTRPAIYANVNIPGNSARSALADLMKTSSPHCKYSGKKKYWIKHNKQNHFDGSAQGCDIFSMLPMELSQSYTKPFILNHHDTFLNVWNQN